MVDPLSVRLLLSKKKSGEGACLKFWKETIRGTKILFCRRVLKFVSPLRDTNSKTTHYPNVHSYSWVVNSWCKRDKIQHQLIVNCLLILAQYRKSYRKTSAVDLLRLNAWRGTKTPVLLESRLLTIFTNSWVQWSVITIFGNGNN